MTVEDLENKLRSSEREDRLLREDALHRSSRVGNVGKTP
jgi:hypothetical protein